MSDKEKKIQSAQDKFRDYIKEYHLIDEGERILIALSGGSDSVFLTYMLFALREEYSLKLSAFHLNHMLRGDAADSDENLARQLCEKLGITFYAYKEDIRSLSRKRGLSEEEAGRLRRYEIIHDLKEGFDKAATAHHADDNAETLIMHIIRGSGIKGLMGIPRLREGYIIRPLLEFTKDEIVSYLKEHQIPYATDATNFEKDAFRSRIRSTIMGEIYKENPAFARGASRLGSIAGDYIALAEEIAEKIPLETSSQEVICAYENALGQKRAVLHALIMRMGRKVKNISDIGYESLKKLGDKIEDTQDTVWEIKLHGICFRRSYDKLIASTEALGEREPFCYPLKAPGLVVCPKAGFALRMTIGEKIEKNDFQRHITYIDYDKILNNVFIRSRRPSDCFRQINLSGTKSVNRLFIDRKVEKSLRDMIPIMVCGGDIIAVIGFETSADYMVEENTRRVLMIEKIPINEKADGISNDERNAKGY